MDDDDLGWLSLLNASPSTQFDFSSLDSLSNAITSDANDAAFFGSPSALLALNPTAIPEGSIFEGMVPGGLTDQGIPATQTEIDAIKNLPTAGATNPFLKALQNAANKFKTPSGDIDWLKLLALAGGMYAGSQDTKPAVAPTGGGTTKRYVGPAQPLTRTITQGRYGPIARYAAEGGVMHGYAGGGPVAMEDGGFVMTKKAVDGAGGPQGIQALLPGARPIRGPGTGTSDSIPAYIQGPKSVTPARVSNGEAYVPRQTVQRAGGSQALYALMNKLQRRA